MRMSGVMLSADIDEKSCAILCFMRASCCLSSSVQKPHFTHTQRNLPSSPPNEPGPLILEPQRQKFICPISDCAVTITQLKALSSQEHVGHGLNHRDRLRYISIRN